jgi:hypothetical protein
VVYGEGERQFITVSMIITSLERGSFASWSWRAKDFNWVHSLCTSNMLRIDFMELIIDPDDD